MLTPVKAEGEPVLSLLIVDDAEISGRGLAALLEKEPSVSVVGVAIDGSGALELWRQHRPAVTVLDLRMPGMSGIQTLCCIREMDPNAAVVILSVYESEEDVMLAFRNGARGFLLKDVELRNLVKGLHGAAKGIPALSPSIALRLAQGTSHIQLTTKEFIVLRLLAQGKANKEIADELGCTVATVKAHLTKLFEKLGVSSRTAAIAAASQRGLVRSSW